MESRDLLGETPLWDETTGTLWWIDIERPTVQSYRPASGVVRRTRRECSFLGSHALTRSGKHIVAEDLDCLLIDDVDAAGLPLASVDSGLDNRLNDGRVDVFGRLWIGTMDNQLRRPNGALYRIDPDGTVTTIADGVIVANGIAFSPDGTAVYFTDTRRHLSWRFDLDPADGAVVGKQVFADYRSTGERPDGACIDVDGCVWQAFFAGGRIVRYTPEGRIDLTVEVPVSNPTCVCFGGRDFRTLFITTARKFLTAEQLSAEPLAGSLLAIDGIGQGLPEYRFAL